MTAVAVGDAAVGAGAGAAPAGPDLASSLAAALDVRKERRGEDIDEEGEEDWSAA